MDVLFQGGEIIGGSQGERLDVLLKGWWNGYW